ncbi:MAG: aspartate--tRNA ligase [Bacteroidia bacterium]|nr:aspartate--tRNA ligase [Bacteroidia bacterium]MBP9688172.1 aspartate--tRNA ligase [Bacteroidia bacterium]
MLRTHTCGELRLSNNNQSVTLTGWVQKSRDLGGMTFVDLRDRYGITQLAFNMETNTDLCTRARKLGREFVLKVTGTVKERESKNANMPTGEIEISVANFEVLNEAITPPFTIEENTDGGDDIRMKYRYLDLRRASVRANLQLRHKVAQQTRNFLDAQEFIEVETPVLIKSTPEGARDFVVPSRMNPGEFYALPQSPQTFKQLLMVSGFDRYYQIVKCFRDEDLRADRQPEFTQIDCEMSFVEQEDILNMFEGLVKHLFKNVKGIEIESLPRMTYADAMKYYGSDKPDTRFEMKFVEANEVVKGKNFPVFDQAELVVGICAKGCAEYTRKQLDELTDFVKRPQVGATGLVYARVNADGTIKSSVDKFYDETALKLWAQKFDAQPGDLILLLAGKADKTRKALNELRLEMGTRLGLRDKNNFSCLWVVDFPLLEFNEEENRHFAMHHPFTSPKPEDIELLNNFDTLSQVRANAYDMVINGVEVGGGSVRIYNKKMQARMFEVLGFTAEEAQQQFGFLMDAFQYGAPPHAGIAFGFDRLCSLFGGVDSIRDFIAFPKNNSGRDIMIDAPSRIDDKQLKELNIRVTN